MNDKCDFNNLPPLLTKEEEKRLGQDLVTGTDEQKELAKYRLVESNIRLVIKMAKDYCNLGVELEDLINEVGSDSVRFMMLNRSSDVVLDFDFEISNLLNLRSIKKGFLCNREIIGYRK